MGPFSMVVCIVLIAMIGRVLTARYRAMESRSAAPLETGETRNLRDEVHQMRERIQVLERVITDNHKSVDLDREIEQLRDR